MLRDLGAVRQAVVAAIVIESLFWAGTGALLGTLLAQPLSAALMPAVAATMQNIYGASVSSLPIFNTGLFWEALLLAFAGVILALVLPLLRATAMSSDEFSMRDETLLLRHDFVLAGVGLALLLLAYVCYPIAS